MNTAHRGAAMTEEAYLLQCLAELREAHERDAKPYLDRLVTIQAMKTPKPFVLTIPPGDVEMLGGLTGRLAHSDKPKGGA